MRSKRELHHIFWAIEANYSFDDALQVIINRHKVNFDIEDQEYFNKLYVKSKRKANSLDPDNGYRLFLKQYYKDVLK